MPEAFVKTGHGLTDMVIDCVEFKFHASNFDLDCLMFSHYKNTATGKALIGISPQGSGLLFSEFFPGSISDNDITVKSGVLNSLNWVEPQHELMADKGFSVQDCKQRSVFKSSCAKSSSPVFGS